MAFDPSSTHKPSPWKAQWIWLNKRVFPRLQRSRPTTFCEETGLVPARALFRREYFLKEPVRHAQAWVSADVKYRLSVNDVRVGRGPAEVGGDYGNQEPLGYWFYDGYDLTDVLKPGWNVICAEVQLQPEVMADYSSGHGGFLFEMEWSGSDGSSGCWKSDRDWKGIPNPAFLEAGRWDARGEPRGWRAQGYGDAEWPTVSVVGPARFESEILSTGVACRWPLLPREIPPLDETPVLPVQVLEPFQATTGCLANPEALTGKDVQTVVPAGAPKTFFLDFGQIHAARLLFDLEGSAGTTITFGFQEIAGRTDRSFSYTLRDGGQTFEGMRLESLRFLQVTLSNLTGPVRIRHMELLSSCYPVTCLGGFACSDAELVQIYEAGRWACRICRQAYHLDSPIHQEALGCTGDYMIESLINYMTFGDPWLTRLDLIRTARLLDRKNGMMFHTSYSLLWVQMLMDHHLFTGDETLLSALAQTVYHLLARFSGYVGTSGLIEKAPNYMFMDWVPVGKHNLHHPPRNLGQGYLTALLVKALDNGSQLADHLGDKARAAGYTLQAERLRQAFHQQLWDEARGLYRDGILGGDRVIPNTWLPQDTGIFHYSQHTNSLAVLYGIAPAEKRADIMRMVFEDESLIQAQPYFHHFVLAAADAAAVFGTFGLPQIRRWSKLLKECSGGLKEVWSGFDCDYSHAWGGTPTFQLPARVLGVMPVEPGFRAVLVRPCAGGLQWAKGTVPTPMGLLHVSWYRQGDISLLEVDAPAGMEVRVETEGLGKTEWVLRHDTGVSGYAPEKDATDE
jgi:alpha-L-rhamnosidase